MTSSAESAPCLLDILKGIDESRVLWVSGEMRLTAGQLKQKLAGQHSLATRLQGQRVAITGTRMPDLAFLFLLLDGICSELVLISSHFSDELVGQLISRAQAGVLLTDHLIADLPVEQLMISALLDQPMGDGEPLKGNLETRWIIPTSGTTSIPKLVSHTLESLIYTIKPSTRYRDYRWGLVYDLTRFAGLQVFLQALMNASALIFASGLPLDQQIQALIAGECSALSATPTLWRRILMDPNSPCIPFKQITLGGEVADQAILSALKNTFPKARVTHIYASTEAGAGFAVNDGLEGFPAVFLQGSNLPGVELAVDKDGYLLIRKARPIQQFIGEQQMYDTAGWINTGDLVELREERYVFLGRGNGAINVGGNKVYPEEIERVILNVPGVSMALVKARKSSIIGSLVEAFVVSDLAADKKELQLEIKRYCRAALAAYKVPALITFVDHLEISATGKVRRNG